MAKARPDTEPRLSTASSKVTPMYNVKKPASSSEVCVIKPKQFDDATEIVDALLDNCTVILNLEGLDINLAYILVVMNDDDIVFRQMHVKLGAVASDLVSEFQ